MFADIEDHAGALLSSETASGSRRISSDICKDLADATGIIFFGSRATLFTIVQFARDARESRLMIKVSLNSSS
jgi:hypothetical protein